MTVRFYRLRPGGPEVIGTLTLKDGVIVANPADTIALTNILAEPLSVYQEDGPPRLIDHQVEPEAFLEALPKVYHGSYFWCVSGAD
jgi:hypothetical protein